MEPERLLIAVPTYNESENVEAMATDLGKLGLDADILFVDDNSPDGTGRLLDTLAEAWPRLSVMHRAGKEGIGSAHQAIIAYAYDNAYETLVTLDCDFTHRPDDIPRLLAAMSGAAIVVGSRYFSDDSLPNWSAVRRFLTKTGHWLTRTFLRMPHDATGAFRAYDLTRIPREAFERVESRGYSFFFESLFAMASNRYPIAEIPIVLPARTYGHSKMRLADILTSVRYLVELYASSLVNPTRYKIAVRPGPIDESLVDPQNWDAYWSTGGSNVGRIYGFVAAVYRGGVLRPNLTRAIRRVFKRGERLLHAGCGSGLVDTRVTRDYRVTAVDISPKALRLYARFNPGAEAVEHADLFHLPFADGLFDGAYNLGVVEHFTDEEIQRILRELHRVLKPGGKLVLFWPHSRAPSVRVLGVAHWVLRSVFGREDLRLHPREISLSRGRRHAADVLGRACFQLDDYVFGVCDLFIQAVVVGKRLP